MAQIVLHNQNNDIESSIDKTRNLGLKSIVEREEWETASLMNDADLQARAAQNAEVLVNQLDTIMKNLYWAATAINSVIVGAYSSKNRMSKYSQLVIGSADIIKETQ